jgi:hypothetical protein
VLFNSVSGMAFQPGSGSTGTIYVSDAGNHNIRAITYPGAIVTTFAGDNSATPAAGNVDGTGNAALFNTPLSLTYDGSKYLWVTDTNNGAVRRIDVGTQAVTTIVGNIATPDREITTGGLPATVVAQGIALDATNVYVVVDDAVLSFPY